LFSHLAETRRSHSSTKLTLKWAKELVMTVAICLRGKVSISSQLYNPTTGEVAFWGDFQFGNTHYHQLPFLRLLIDQESVDMCEVVDDYHEMIPYLKHAKQFRNFMRGVIIGQALADPRISECSLLKHGVLIYGDKLGTYSSTSSLVSQAKTLVNRIDPKKANAEKDARAVLKVLGVSPNVDMGFLVLDSAN
jgi:hypothetical protein